MKVKDLIKYLRFLDKDSYIYLQRGFITYEFDIEKIKDKDTDSIYYLIRADKEKR